MNSRFPCAAILPLMLMVVSAASAATADGHSTGSTKGPCGRMPMAMVHGMDFIAFYASNAQAVEAAAEIDRQLFDIIVRTSASTPEWIVRAVYRNLPEPGVHARQVEAMERIATKNGARDHGPGCASLPYRPLHTN